jgi:hypothetical protein
MAQAVSCWPFTVEAWVHVGQSMWELWWTEWHRDRLLSESFGFSISISLTHFSIRIYLGDEQ